ncbi:MAG: prepilin-type N-terminal cleavage/methylation domain-containing protein [Candidatus Yonathbacteria bacterium]|nr:prepilin-type N-terminal cleavage/methylation domain-containing protein [Candidatus Yonathbacteria bacterium]
MPRSNFRGFTALEILIVISILGVLLTIIVPSFRSFRQKSILNTETMELLTTINRARLLSVSSKNDQQFGVHFESGKVVLFQGTVYYVASTTTNEAHIFDPAVTLSSITVNGGGSDVVFQKVTGATTQNATTTLLVTGTNASTTVLIRLSGAVTAN